MFHKAYLKCSLLQLLLREAKRGAKHEANVDAARETNNSPLIQKRTWIYGLADGMNWSPSYEPSFLVIAV